MREDVLRNLAKHPELKPVDADFRHLFVSWFNRGFLVLRHIDWSTPASILEKIIQYEAVHEINGWTELRSRLVAEVSAMLRNRGCATVYVTHDPSEAAAMADSIIQLESRTATS